MNFINTISGKTFGHQFAGEQLFEADLGIGVQRAPDFGQFPVICTNRSERLV